MFMEKKKGHPTDLLNSVRVVLVGTTHPGNIGATARAMKNMGIFNLTLVEPKDFPSKEAIYRSKAAKDVLENAQVYENLEDAVSDCELVIGTSARGRKVPWPVLSPMTRIMNSWSNFIYQDLIFCYKEFYRKNTYVIIFCA